MASNQMVFGFEKNQNPSYQHGINPGIIANSTKIDPFKLDTSVLFKVQDMMIQQQQLDLQNRKMLMDNEQFKLEQDRLNKVYDLSKRGQDYEEAKNFYANLKGVNQELTFSFLNDNEQAAVSQYSKDIDNITSEFEKDPVGARSKMAKFELGIIQNKTLQQAKRKEANIKALYEAWNKDPDKYDISLIQEAVRKAQAGDPSVNEFSFNPGNFRVYSAAEKQKSLMNAASGIFEKKEISKVEKDADGNEYVAKYNILPDKKETYNAFYNRIVNDPIMTQSLNTDWENKKLSDKRAAELNGVPYVEDKNKKAFIDNEIGKMHSMFFDDYSAVTKDDVVMTNKDYVSNPNIAGVGDSGKPTDTTLEAASLMREFNIDADAARRIASGGSRVVNLNGELHWLDVSEGTPTYSPTGVKVDSASKGGASIIPYGNPEADKQRVTGAGTYYKSKLYISGNPYKSGFENTAKSESPNPRMTNPDMANGKLNIGHTQMQGDAANNVLNNFPKFKKLGLDANNPDHWDDIDNFMKNLTDYEVKQLYQYELKQYKSTGLKALEYYNKSGIKAEPTDVVKMYLAQIAHQSGEGGYSKIISNAAKSIKALGKEPTEDNVIEALHNARDAYFTDALSIEDYRAVKGRIDGEYLFAKDVSGGKIQFNPDGTVKGSEITATTTPKGKATPDRYMTDPVDKKRAPLYQREGNPHEYQLVRKTAAGKAIPEVWVESKILAPEVKGKERQYVMKKKEYKLEDGRILTYNRDKDKYEGSDGYYYTFKEREGKQATFDKGVKIPIKTTKTSENTSAGFDWSKQ